MLKRACWSVALLLALVGCSRESKPEDYAPFAKIVADADRVVLYEGLPHPDYEEELLQKELAEKKTFSNGKFSFYAEPMPLNDSESEQLREVFDDIDAFSDRPPGQTKCGPYHPDYAIEFSKGDESVLIEYCLGCGEIKVFSGSTMLYLSPSSNTGTRSKAIIGDRWQNRPQSEVAKYSRR